MITPIEDYPELASAIGVKSLLLKREDIHPYGSHKGRSIPVMINHYHKEGDSRFVISSSGNAALAAAMYIRELNTGSQKPITLDIYVGNHIVPNKLAKLQALTDANIRVLTKERPLQAVIQATEQGARSLRQSTDDIALVGYTSLAQELSAVKNIGAVFMGTSSGTTAEALARYFTDNNKPIQVHIVQTSSCHPIVDDFETYDGPEETSIADAIIDKNAQRKSALVPLIKKTGGHGWVATNESIQTAQELLKKNADLDISTNGALAVAGAIQASYRGHKIEGATVCIVGGE